MPASIERRIICAVESRGGEVRTLCGVTVAVDWSERRTGDEIVTCPLCVEEIERRWASDDQTAD